MVESFFHAVCRKNMFLIRGIIVCACILLPTIADAAQNSNQQFATPLIQSAHTLQLAPLQRTSFGIGFKNKSGSQWIAAENSQLELRSSVTREDYFYSSSWKNRNTVMDLPHDVSPGSIVYFWFTLEAPSKVGVYPETFYLYRNGVALGETKTTLIVTVVQPLQINHPLFSENVQSVAPINSAPVVQAIPFSLKQLSKNESSAPVLLQKNTPVQLTALRLITSARELTMQHYQRVSFGIGFKNTSTLAWKHDDAIPIVLRTGATKEDYFYDSSWLGHNQVMTLPQDAPPGTIVYFWFTLFAPMYPGQYMEHFSLFKGDQKIDGGDGALPIIVEKTSGVQLATSTVVTHTESPTQSDSQSSVLTQNTQPGVQQQNGMVNGPAMQEPSIRVGLFHTTDPIRITSLDAYDIRDQDGALLFAQAAGDVTTVIFDPTLNAYTVTTATHSIGTQKYIRFQRAAQSSTQIAENASATPAVPDPTTVFQILSYTNHPSWSSTINDNAFQGTLEVHYASSVDQLWVINELPLEEYLKGIGETSDSSPHEFQKALIVAARTYALNAINHGSKYADEGFTVLPTDADQVYRGYNSQMRMPTVAQSVDETKGMVVYYGDALAITPYFSQSDGRTRSWSEVWAGGPYPWLISKPDPSCVGLPLLGHGVGMSARGAIAMALDGKTFADILTYYYTGIDIHILY